MTFFKEAGFDYQDIVSTDKSEETITDSNYDNDNVIINGAKVINDETQETSSREFDDGIVREEKEFADANEDDIDNADDDDVVTNAIVETVSREANLSSDDQIDIEEEEFVDKDSQEYDRSESNYRYDDLLSQELPDKNTADTLGQKKSYIFVLNLPSTGFWTIFAPKCSEGGKIKFLIFFSL